MDITALETLGYDVDSDFETDKITINGDYIPYFKTTGDNLTISYESSYSNYGRQLFIVFFDFFDSLNSNEHYKYIKVLYYSYDFYNKKISKFAKEISAFIFNDFLVFTSTALPIYTNSNSDNFFPILLIFGYPNGTDFEIDIYLI